MKPVLGGCLLIAAIVAVPAVSHAQYTSSQHLQRCLQINKPYGGKAIARCHGYQRVCLQTGNWTAPDYPRTSAIRR